ncbi:Hint domain-containing protein [Marimonas lutisalis]|uniref:Hint domain-containing protein n=1 Tax=Marimonas lutisalis TaxID=2545756 RepID=UPI0010F72AB0|nr:Hint domain-containing protein [Marimonas lutisalis]
MTPGPSRPAHSLPVYSSAMLPAVNGANMGDGLSFADELVLEDSYALAYGAELGRLSLHAGDDGRFVIADDTALGAPGATVVLDSCLTLMTRDSQVSELLVLVEVDAEGNAAEIYGLPLAPLHPKTDYLLVGIERDTALSRFAQVACVSFTRGKHIALATGEQRPIQDLRVGDRVLTRDDGPQEIRWIGQHTVRAVGEFAPIVITAGTLHNVRELIVSPDHRLFIYQRSDRIGAGRSEVLVKARHLVNGDSVRVQDGGFVDYFQLLFDRHQIIFAEGIAAETLLIDPRTRSALPRDLAEKMAASLPRHGDAAHLDFEIGRKLLDRPDAAELLRRATTR